MRHQRHLLDAHRHLQEDDDAIDNKVLNTNNSQDDKDGSPERVTILPLLLQISPTPEELTDDQVNRIHDTVNSLVEDQFLLLNDDDPSDVLSEGVTFGYSSFLGVSFNQWVSSAGQSYCGRSLEEATKSCDQPCVYGPVNRKNEEGMCPSGQLCFANVMFCPASDNRRLQSLRGGTKSVSAGHRTLAEDQPYTIIQLAGGLATFRAVAPATVPSEKRLSKLAAKLIIKNLAESIEGIDIDDVSASVLPASKVPFLAATPDAVAPAAIADDEAQNPKDEEPLIEEIIDVPKEPADDGIILPPVSPPVDNSVDSVDAEPIDEKPEKTSKDTQTTGDEKTFPTTTTDTATATSSPPKESLVENDNSPPILLDPSSENVVYAGNAMPEILTGESNIPEGNGGSIKVKAETIEESSSNNGPILAGAITGVLLLVGLVASVLLLKRHRRKKSADTNLTEFKSSQAPKDLAGPSEQGNKAATGSSTGTTNSKNDDASFDGTASETLNTSKDETEVTLDSSTQANSKRPPLAPYIAAAYPKTAMGRYGGQLVEVDNDDVSPDALHGQSNPLKRSESFEMRRHFESITLRKDMMIPDAAIGMESRDRSRVQMVNTELGRMPKNVDVEDRGNLITYPRHLKKAQQQKRQQKQRACDGGSSKK